MAQVMILSGWLRESLTRALGVGVLIATFLVPIQDRSAQAAERPFLRSEFARATRIDIFELYAFRESRTNVRSSYIRDIACRMSLRRGEAGWSVIERALNGAGIVADPNTQVGQDDLRIGIALADESGEISALYFQDNVLKPPPMLRGEMDARSVLVPTALADAVHLVMGPLKFDCGSRT